MKIKAAVVDEKGADFKIRDDVELAPMGPDDLQDRKSTRLNSSH